MRRLYTIFIFIFLLPMPMVSASIVINEIMYNPEGDDNNHEYVELYLDEIINLENYIIQDKNSQDSLEVLQFIENSNYALIVEEGFNYEDLEASVYSAGATIGNNLNNEDDFIIIKDSQENILDIVHYYSQWGGDGNGMSLCKIDNLWQECASTPGRENNPPQNEIVVEYVIDGDTFILTNRERVRLIGIDTPEVGEYYYREATDRLRELVEGEEVILERDIEDRDRYDRLLRYVYLDDLFINLILVEEGFARAYPYGRNLRYEDEFAEAEEIARENGLGIWSRDNECDWEVEILSNTIFGNKTNFEFRYFINKIEGERTRVTLIRSIEDIYGNILRDYGNYSIEITNYHTTPILTPNLNEGVYLIKGEIFPDCNDIDLENNIISKLIIILPEGLNQDYRNLEITEFLPNPIGDENGQMPAGEWVELYNPGNTSINLEGLVLNDNYGDGVIISNINILQNNTIIQPKSYLTIYKNGNGKLTLSNNGFEKIQLFYENILLDEVSYSHTIEGLSWSKVNGLWIKTIPTPNQQNHFEEPDFSSHLEIDNIYLGKEDKAKFGEILRIRIIIYKGDTSKYNLDLYLIDENNNQVSKRSEINIEDKFTNYTLIVPLQIDPNCNSKYPNGTYEVVLKGLDEMDTEEIEIEGITNSLCKIIKEETSSSKTTQPQESLELEQETFTQPITSSLIYQSSDIKARNLGIYFFSAVLLLLIIYLIFKKNL